MWSSPSERRAYPPRLAAACACAAFAACIANPVRRVRSGIERTESGPNEVRSQTNLVEVAVQDRVGPDLEYRFIDKFAQSSQRVSTATSDSDDETSLHRPSFDLVMTSGPIRWTQLFQSQVDRTLVGQGADTRLARNDVLEKLEWTPLDLPQVTAWVDYRTIESDFSVDQSTVESRLQVSHALEPFGYEYTFRNERTEEEATDALFDRTEHIARGTYQDTHADGRLSTGVTLFATEREHSSEVPSGGTPTVQVAPVAGFSDVDPTPQISALTQNPALVDANTTASAGIDIGGFASGGQTFWNMGVELPAGQSVEVVQLKTVASVPSNFVGQFAFSVWVSDDNTFWTLTKSSAAFVYDAANLHFRLSIPSTSRRYLKVVNTASPAAAPSVLVAEMEVFRGVGTTTATTDESVESATTNLSWRVSDEVVVGVDVFGQTAESDAAGTATRDESRLDTGVWAAWTPAERFEANLRASDQQIEDRVLRDEENVTLLGVFSYRPLRTLDVDLSLTRIDRDVDGRDDVRTDVAQALASAELLPALRAEASLERSDVDDTTNQRDIGRWIATAALIADVTPEVESTLRVRADEATVRGPGAAGIPDPSEDRYELTLVWRPSEQLIAETELEWIESFAGDGLDQRWRLDWIPFRDGALDAQLDFDRRRTESFTDARTDRCRALVRYSLSAFTYFEFQYAAEDPSQGDTTEVMSLSFNFSS
jgi:hypothetical protein